MNDTIIKQDKLSKMKKLVHQIEELKTFSIAFGFYDDWNKKIEKKRNKLNRLILSL
jgi:hypothetical protein